jgi:hypothetical protein
MHHYTNALRPCSMGVGTRTATRADTRPHDTDPREVKQMLGESPYRLLLLEAPELLKSISVATSIIAAVFGVLTVVATRTVPWIRAKRGARLVKNSLTGQLYTPEGVNRSLRYYLSPDCQDLDPAGGEEPRLVLGVRQKLFDLLDRALGSGTEYRYIILLADSGMGKTSALLNYYVRHLRRLRKLFKLAVIPLGIPDADERIVAIEDKPGTVLFLDALDEDTQAIVDHVERLRLLIQSTRDFKRVLISSRTQFFAKEEEIPSRTGIIKVYSLAAGEPKQYVFHKIYLSPFTDNQVDGYIRRRYPLWQRRKRELARGIVAQMPDLAVRPMLLAHVDDLVHSNMEIHTASELYEQMVNAWIRREEGIISGTSGLREFSERLAVDLYLKRAERGAERIPAQDLRALAVEWGVAIDDWRLTGRSLLNRDVEGNYKFAHRSIMEYLFVCRFVHGPEPACLDSEWTGQIRKFFWETIHTYHFLGDGLDVLAPVLATDPPRARAFIVLLFSTVKQMTAMGNLSQVLSPVSSRLMDLLVSQIGSRATSVILFRSGGHLGEPSFEAAWGSQTFSRASIDVYKWLAEFAGGRNFDPAQGPGNTADASVLPGLTYLADLGVRSAFSVWVEDVQDESFSDVGGGEPRPRHLLVGHSRQPSAFTESRIVVLREAVELWRYADWLLRQSRSPALGLG